MKIATMIAVTEVIVFLLLLLFNVPTVWPERSPNRFLYFMTVGDETRLRRKSETFLCTDGSDFSKKILKYIFYFILILFYYYSYVIIRR